MDPALFRCPWLILEDGGTAFFQDDEVRQLREYLLKGGFLWADDFWGSYAWEHWRGELAKVLPPAAFPLTALPKNPPLFPSM